MNTLEVIGIVLIPLICFLIGYFVGRRFHKPKPDAILGIDTRDPEKDYYDFTLLIPTGDVTRKSRLQVDVMVKK